MATDPSSDESDHQHHYLDQGKHNDDASNDSESRSDSGSESASNSDASSDSDDSSDEASSSEVLTRNSRGIQLLASMLDLEASESHSSEDENDDDDDLAEHTHEYPNSRQARRNDHQSFPKFALLPYELRQRIWEMFCPDLTAKARVYEFRILFAPHFLPNNPYDVWEGPILEQQTAPRRVMSAVHRESREHVLKKFPDVLTFRKGRNTIRWDCKNDVVILSGRALPPFPPIPGFSDHIRNLALNVDLGHYIDTYMSSERPEYEQIFKQFCPQLSRAFCVIDDADCSARHLRWCANRENHHYFVRTEEEEPGVGEDAEYLYCWRNPSMTREFTIDNSIPGLFGDLIRRSMEYTENGGTDTENLFQPLIRFSFETGLRRFEKIVKKQNDDTDWSFSDTDSDDELEDEEPDEYESSGIDDSEISEDEGGGSESGDDLVVVTDDSDQEEEASSDEEQGPFHAARLAEFDNGPIQILDDSDDASPSGHNAHQHAHLGPSDSARFSSMEPSDSSTMDHGSSSSPRAGPSRFKGSGRKRVLDSDSEQEEKHDVPPRKAARISNESRRRARATVVLSDDEDDVEDEQMEHQSPTEKRPNPESGTAGERPEDHVVISDDDEDEEEEMMRRRLRRKAIHRHKVVSDDDDEEEEEEVAMPKKIRSRRRLQPPASDTEDDDDDGGKNESSMSDSDDSNSDDSSDEEDPSAKPLTLAEKLELHRRNNPIPDSDDDGDNDDDDDDGSVSGDDYDGRNYADFQDDEEGNEISGEDDDEDEDEEGGLIIDMADEDDEEDEEDEY